MEEVLLWSVPLFELILRVEIALRNDVETDLKAFKGKLW